MRDAGSRRWISHDRQSVAFVGQQGQFMKGAGTASSPAAQPSSRQQPGTRQPLPFVLHQLALVGQREFTINLDNLELHSYEGLCARN